MYFWKMAFQGRAKALVLCLMFGASLLASGCATTESPRKNKKSAYLLKKKKKRKARMRAKRKNRNRGYSSYRGDKPSEAKLIRRGNRVRYAPALDAW